MYLLTGRWRLFSVKIRRILIYHIRGFGLSFSYQRGSEWQIVGPHSRAALWCPKMQTSQRTRLPGIDVSLVWLLRVKQLEQYVVLPDPTDPRSLDLPDPDSFFSTTGNWGPEDVDSCPVKSRGDPDGIPTVLLSHVWLLHNCYREHFYNLNNILWTCISLI